MKGHRALAFGAALVAAFLLAGAAVQADVVRVYQEATAGAGDFAQLSDVGIFTDTQKSAAQIFRYRRQSTSNPNWFSPRPLCPVSYTGFLDIQEVNLEGWEPGTVTEDIEIAGIVSPVPALEGTTQMWVMDTADGRALFVVHDIIDNSSDFNPGGDCPAAGAAGIPDDTTGGRQHMRFDLVGGFLRYLVQDDQEPPFDPLPDQEKLYTPEGTFRPPDNLSDPVLGIFNDTLVAQHNWEPSRTDGVVLGLPEGCDWTLFMRYRDRVSSTGISAANIVGPGGSQPVDPSVRPRNFGRTIKLECAASVTPDISKELTEGPPQVGTSLPEPTPYTFAILYTNAALDVPVRVLDTVPAEFEVLDVTPTAGTAGFHQTGKGRKQSATRIEWDLEAQTDCSAGCLLGVDIQTAPSPGRRGVFKPTSCGPLPVNDGATAYEVDPLTGEIATVPDPDTGLPVPVIVLGPSNALEVEAVAGTKPCAPLGLTVTLVGQDTLALDWEDNVEEVAVYNVYRSPDGGPFSIIATVPDSAYDDTGLDPGHYCYVVKAEFAEGAEGNESETVCETVPEPIVP